MGERSIIGSNDQLVDELGRYVELGFDEFIVPDFTLGGTAEERFEKYGEFRGPRSSHSSEVTGVSRRGNSSATHCGGNGDATAPTV